MSDQIVDDGQGKKPKPGGRRKADRKRRAGGTKATTPAKPEAKTLWQDHKVLLAVITAVLAVAGGITVGFFNSWWLPKPPKTLNATLTTPTVEANVVLKDHLKHTDSSPADYTQAQLEQVGYLIHVQVQLIGFEGRTCTLRWEAHDAASKSKIVFADWDDEQIAIDLIPDAGSDITSPAFWVPLSPANKPFVVWIMIHDDKGMELVRTKTEVIKPTAAAKPTAPRSANQLATAKVLFCLLRFPSTLLLAGLFG
jgi:hypothetical protein